nr:MAG TPA: hypothetical protein [Caudoviricetes sp.]
METKELIEEIQVAVSLKDYLDRSTKIEGETVVSNHQRFVEVTEDREGNLRIVPGIAWPNDSGRATLDYDEMKTLPADAEEESEKLADHFADYLLNWQEDFDFPGEVLEDIVLKVEAEIDDAKVEQVDLEDGAVGVESCGSGVSIQFQEFERSGFYYVSVYRRNDDGEPEDVCRNDFQDGLEGYELSDDEKKSELATKYAGWLIGEIRAATE